jgi:hypothetical protein
MLLVGPQGPIFDPAHKEKKSGKGEPLPDGDFGKWIIAGLTAK